MENKLDFIIAELQDMRKEMNGNYKELKNDTELLKQNMAVLITAQTTLSNENEQLQKQIDVHSADIVKLRAQ